MKTPNRDILVLVKDDQLDEQAIEYQLEQLNQLLIGSESTDNLSISHEVLDLNRYRMHIRQATVKKIMGQRQLKPFVFLINKN